MSHRSRFVIPSHSRSFALNVRAVLMMLAAIVFGLVANESSADENERVLVDFFESSIRPALIEHCYECHSAETEASGGLLLDSAAGWQRGGDLGESIVPGDASKSLLIRAVEYSDPDLQMPPDGKLPDEVISALRRWVDLGATDPRRAQVVDDRPRTGLSVEQAENHWAYRPLVDSDPESFGRVDGASTVIDQLILHRLDAEDLTPADKADRYTLIRRLTFDLTGLPPTVSEIRAFLTDDRPFAYERLVDRLLMRPQFGEHFARHWMDVARYAESITLRGFVLEDAWRYRDYLVAAYNADHPFNEMIRDQIAGDLLETSDLGRQQQAAIATGFLALGNTNLEDQDKTKLEFDFIDEQLQTIGRAFLAQTIGCARCHDHKFDPIPTADYYSLAAILRSTKGLEHSNVSKWIRRPIPLGASEEERYETLRTELKQVESDLASLEKNLKAEQKRIAPEKESDETRRLGAEKKRLDGVKKKLGIALAKRPQYLSVLEAESPTHELAIRVRGMTHSPGKMVKRGFLQAVGRPDQFAAQIAEKKSGRVALANWIADAENPLTARVYVNRVWCWLMGEGIVSTENNFGTRGEQPSHPKLLDHLASSFVNDGWSTKQLVRQIVLSDAYQRSSRAEADSEDVRQRSRRYCATARVKRLPVESMRDAIVAIGGNLERRMEGSEIRSGTKSDYDYVHRSNRRSLYWPVFRNSLPPLFAAFDFPDPSMSVGQRSASTVATQALGLTNSAWVMKNAESAAKRICRDETPRGLDERLEQIFLECLGRPPSKAEKTHCVRFLQDENSNDADGAGIDEQRWQELIHSLFASIDFRYLE